MNDSNFSNNDFLNRALEIIDKNISNDKFGVSELAQEIGMSRSNLLRKIKKLTNLSVSQFISQRRLESAMSLLNSSSYNISEVSYQVGFSSTSYFIKCFREHYGYPPGEVGKTEKTEINPVGNVLSKKKRISSTLILSLSFVAIIIALLIIINPFSSEQNELENSIAVLPFKNDSNDSTNVYLINGLMESLLNNFQQIEDLRVISRTSVEKYRDNPKTITEIASELNVNYIIEGSGQKIGDKIQLNIQLIDASRDRHLWSKQYSRDVGDIFELQREVATNIVNEIEAIITQEEEERINKVPTDNLIAYDYFLKGLDLFYQSTAEGLVAAIPYFEKAIEYDNEFARAYANISISYSMLDIFQVDKKYIEESNNYADKALSLDPKLAMSLVAKALCYMNIGEAFKAEPFLEKAIKFNPNSAMVINILSDFYANYVPNTEKYLEYALRGIGVDITAHDSVETSFIYLHLSNAFIQSGFVSEAELYIEKSLAFNPDNLYAAYVKVFILYARGTDLEQTKDLLIEVMNKDLSRLDIIQEVGKIYYYLRDYENAFLYYNKFLKIKEAMKLDVYRFENAKIAVVMSKLGFKKEADQLLEDYKASAENDESLYKDLSLAMYYSYIGDVDNAIKHLKLFSLEDNYHYWTLLFLEIDPLVDQIKDHPEFKKIIRKINKKFWDRHDNMKASLNEKGLTK